MNRIGIAQYLAGKSKSHALEKVLMALNSASKEGAKMVVFGECWFGGYPAWIDICPGVALWDNDAVKNAWAELMDNALVIESDAFESMKQACKEHEIILALGCNEAVQSGVGNGTLFNSFIIIDDSGQLVHHHRKLMPTFNEKLLYGQSDNASSLKAVETSIGRIGGLICWEHWMAMSRYKLHVSGEDIHLALWPDMKDRHLLASRHYAFEGRCVVVAVGQLMHKDQFPQGLTIEPSIKEKMEDDWILRGGSTVIGPDAELILPPQYGEEGVFYVDIPSAKELLPHRMQLSAGGHYDRPELW